MNTTVALLKCFLLQPLLQTLYSEGPKPYAKSQSIKYGRGMRQEITSRHGWDNVPIATTAPTIAGILW